MVPYFVSAFANTTRPAPEIRGLLVFTGIWVARMRFSAVILVAGLLCFGSASAQLEEILRGVFQQQRTQDLINSLPGDECKAFGRQFLESCTADIITTTSLADDLATAAGLITLDENVPLQVKGNQLSTFIPSATPSGACCDVSCKMAKKGCLCVATARDALRNAFSLDGGDGFEKVMNGVASVCRAKAGSNFDAIITDASCTQENYDNVVVNYSCTV